MSPAPLSRMPISSCSCIVTITIKRIRKKRNIAECIVAKNRHGETGKVELRWMPEYTTFGTLENRYDEE